jgi:hypothetical protein
MDNIDLARRLVFIMSSVARRLGLSSRIKPDALLAASVNSPGSIKPGEFAAIYKIWQLLKPRSN